MAWRANALDDATIHETHMKMMNFMMTMMMKKKKKKYSISIYVSLHVYYDLLHIDIILYIIGVSHTQILPSSHHRIWSATTSLDAVATETFQAMYRSWLWNWANRPSQETHLCCWELWLLINISCEFQLRVIDLHELICFNEYRIR